MTKLDVYVDRGSRAVIDQLPMRRDWMDMTFDRHAYQCFPVSLSNRLGWGISFKEDISFIWDGINDSTENHVTVLKGNDFANPLRGNRTVSFDTGMRFIGEKNVSLMTMPVPNQFIDGAQCMTTILSTSVLHTQLSIAWMITRPNVEITIPAGTPVAAILPISLKDTQSYSLTVKDGSPKEYSDESWINYMRDRSAESIRRNSTGDWTNFYRDAVDHLGQKVGEHESKKIIMDITYEKNN
jgi:hypothetical protein